MYCKFSQNVYCYDSLKNMNKKTAEIIGTKDDHLPWRKVSVEHWLSQIRHGSLKDFNANSP